MIEKSNASIDAKLWNAYAGSVFRFKTQWQVSSYAVITAWNPNSNQRSKEENCISNQALEKQLNHVNYVPVTVGDDSFEWYEESYAVELSPAEAIILAKTFDQNAIYYVVNGVLYLIACVEPLVRKKIGAIEERLV
ncbi:MULTISPECIES: DUF3293 domain-containing protein [Vibrio]|jgi:hypothetical protein|uniref:DUF3293 domain-containing protein n=1 Tax=Vibrio TaxID=662 RepID=UPI000E68AA1E|nr:DUF3293 domain-containing protein [Vibrio sp. PID23_8]RIZ54670.1 hypothetical protein AK966_09640 [Vibrio sp. PID23_8]